MASTTVSDPKSNVSRASSLPANISLSYFNGNQGISQDAPPRNQVIAQAAPARIQEIAQDAQAEIERIAQDARAEIERIAQAAQAGNQEIAPDAQAGESIQKILSGVMILAAAVTILLGLIPIFFYIYCYFGDEERYLQFFGHMFYRPSLILAPLVWSAASLKILTQDYQNRKTSWVKVFVFTKESCKNRWNAIKVNKVTTLISTLVIYFLLPFAVCVVRVFYMINTPPECLSVILWLWFFTELFGVWIFDSFFYLVYLKRLELQESLKDTSKTIHDNVGKFSPCFIAIKTFFEQYYSLRSLMLPLLYILLFESIFGITVFLSWNYSERVNSLDVVPSSTTSAPYWHEHDAWCSFNCSAQDFTHLKKNLSYNLWIFLRHVMTILLPYWSVSGMDMKYMWDDLTTDLYLSYKEKHEPVWKKITVYVKGLHPETSTYSMLNIIVPVMALVTGVFTGDNL